MLKKHWLLVAIAASVVGYVYRDQVKSVVKGMADKLKDQSLAQTAKDVLSAGKKATRAYGEAQMGDIDGAAQSAEGAVAELSR